MGSETNSALSASQTLAAILAVGTEITDGQIINGNSAWISERLVNEGFMVLEHRTVPDDRPEIERALRELAERVDVLFVTGGLGPTSDDFTREVVAKAFDLSLEWSEECWRGICAMLNERGIEIRENQKQQCYFPRDSRRLLNPAGTACGFTFSFSVSASGEYGQQLGRIKRVYVLPGPPVEIAAIWNLNLKTEISTLANRTVSEKLAILRCFARPESEIAEKVEEAILGSGLRVGYREYGPYVEVKLWYPVSAETQAQAVIKRVELALGNAIVNRDDEDVADSLIERLSRGEKIVIQDFATQGLMLDRMAGRISEGELPQDRPLSLQITTHFDTYANTDLNQQNRSQDFSMRVSVIPVEERLGWKILFESPGKATTEKMITLPYKGKLFTLRSRRFLVESLLMCAELR